jgi:hypothetical protein
MAADGQPVVASSIYGLILAALTRRVVPSFKRRYARCTNGTKMRRCAMCIWKTTKLHHLKVHNYQRADGSREAGLYVSIKTQLTVKLLYLSTRTEELIAPSSIEFFDSKWQKMGTKATLREEIAVITRIDSRVLDGEAPTNRTIAERMSWASDRITSRVEDTAYSLMGIFDVFLPMLYGEGDRAFVRLQEEIMKQSEDYTIFAWKSAGPGPSSRGIFARSPSEFTGRLHIADNISPSIPAISQYRALDHHLYDPAAMTSRGLLITLPLRREDTPESGIAGTTASDTSRHLVISGSSRREELQAGTYLALICRINSRTAELDQILCIWLRKHPERAMFTRTSPETVVILPTKRASGFKMHTIYTRSFGSVEDD